MHFEDYSFNKKHKGIRKGEKGMDVENFASRITTSKQIDLFKAPKIEKMTQSRFTIVGGEMEPTTISKSKFSQTNDKRFYNLNVVTSLPIGIHFYKMSLYTKKVSVKK